MHLDLQTDITINETVIMKCSGEKSIESWYFFKGNNLLIDDGSVNSDYSLDKIHTNHTMHSMYIEFKEFSQNYLDVYKCVREKGATSNSLDLKEVFKNGRSLILFYNRGSANIFTTFQKVLHNICSLHYAKPVLVILI